MRVLKAQEYLFHSQAAELARTTRQKRTRRSVLKGGILYTNEARYIVHQREEAEVEKADLALHRAQLAVERRDIARWKKYFKEAKKKIKDKAPFGLPRYEANQTGPKIKLVAISN
jgi:hypothetical protein